MGRYESGAPFTIEDNWKAIKDPHRMLLEPWVGTTTFKQGDDPPDDDDKIGKKLPGDAEAARGDSVQPAADETVRGDVGGGHQEASSSQLTPAQ